MKQQQKDAELEANKQAVLLVSVDGVGLIRPSLRHFHIAGSDPFLIIIDIYTGSDLYPGPNTGA